MNPLQPQARLFRLVRHTNPTAILAEGVEWSDGTVALRWRGPWSSTSTWDCVDSVLAMHGTGGRTQVHWFPGVPATRSSTITPQPPSPPSPVGSVGSAGAPSSQSKVPVWLPAPGIDGLCSRCGRPWPCLSCGP